MEGQILETPIYVERARKALRSAGGLQRYLMKAATIIVAETLVSRRLWRYTTPTSRHFIRSCSCFMFRHRLGRRKPVPEMRRSDPLVHLSEQSRTDCA